MIALHTESLHKYGLNRIFEFASKAKYDGIEIAVSKKNYDTQNAEYIMQLSKEYNLPILALQTPINGNRKSVKHVIAMAIYLKCPVVVITPPKLTNFQFTKWLKKELPLLRKKKHIQIALSNTGGKTILGFLPERAMNDLSDLKKFGMTSMDLSMIASKKQDLMRFYKNIKTTLVHVHLSNVKNHKEYMSPENGILPVESFLKRLEKDNYKGTISIKINPKELFAGEDEKVLKKLKEIKTFVKDYYNL